MRRSIVRSTILLIIAISILPAACSSHGRLRLQQAGEFNVTPEDLVRTWKNYDVYYSGVATHRISAILFDPKDDGKTMAVHPWWVKVEDQALLEEVMEWITFDMNYDPVVWTIVGPDNGFYGYLYTGWNHALIRVVDEKTLWIDDMSWPPDSHGANTRDRGAPVGQ